jgi:hydrogenase nickel incorporation protein HypA/HybF
VHETSLVKDLVRRAERLARENGARRVTRLRVRLGALSHFSPAHFREHVEIAARGSVAEGAALDIESLDDPADPRAQDVILEDLDIEEP